MTFGILLSVWVLITFFTCKVECVVVAKSDITICENTQKDPLNVLYNKKCEKKLVVLAEVKNRQGETEKLYASIKKVHDTVEKEDARLYNPFIITLSMSPINLIYPIYYRGTVNNRPYEVMLPNKDFSCYNARCRRHRDRDGKAILDSRGFCCECERSGLNTFGRLYTFSVSNQYHRGRIDCNKYKSSAHCMNFDQLWYDVHEIGLYSFDFNIWVKAYDQVEKVVGNKTVIDWVDGGQITLSPQKKGGIGKYGRVSYTCKRTRAACYLPTDGSNQDSMNLFVSWTWPYSSELAILSSVIIFGRIVAKYIGKLSAGREYPILQDHYLMIPNLAKMRWGVQTHPQLINGYEDYLIIPFKYVEFSNSQKCDVIGVSLSAFAQQSTYYGKNGYGCYQKQGTCLRNQIYDLFTEDQKRRDKGERTKFFPESFGKITGVKERPGSTDRVVEFESEETSSMLVYLEISADDLMLIYNRAGGMIVKAFAKEFEAQSRNGLAQVIVQNTGLVTADFYVTLEDCSDGVRGEHEKRSSINPQTNHKFEFRLEAYKPEGGSFFCNVKLYDSRRKELDTSKLSINSTSTCICIGGCGCTCGGQENTCVNESVRVFDQEKPGTADDFFGGVLDKLEGVAEVVKDVVNNVKGVVSSIWSMIPNLGNIWTIIMIVGIVILLCIGRVICSFVPSGMMASIVKKAAKTMKTPDKPPPAPAPTIIVMKQESESEHSDEDGERMNKSLENEIETRSSKRTSEFLFEFCFFIILPLLLVYKVVKLVWRFTFRPLYLWVKTTVLEKDESSDDEDGVEENLDSDKEESSSDKQSTDDFTNDDNYNSDNKTEDGPPDYVLPKLFMYKLIQLFQGFSVRPVFQWVKKPILEHNDPVDGKSEEDKHSNSDKEENSNAEKRSEDITNENYYNNDFKTKDGRADHKIDIENNDKVDEETPYQI